MTEYLPRLHWFPKRFEPGDTAGEGSRKTLGAPGVDSASLLIREMAQNSWDARLPSGEVTEPPSFEVRMRLLSSGVRRVLLDHVFRAVAPGSSIRGCLETPGCAALEISDRGTKGLGGPDHITADPHPEGLDDYVRLVLAVGAPHAHDSKSGGTYGFGKTASYLASAHSTVVIWSRYREPGGAFGERFIASCMGDTFNQGGDLYTGRQWWALPRGEKPDPNELSFRPASGAEARRLGEAVFESRFGPEETGTSIMILSPQLSEKKNPLEGLEEDVTKAMVMNLWPKIPTDQPLSRRMNLRVWSGTTEVPVRFSSPVAKALQRCLEGIRQVQAGEEHNDSLVQVSEIRCGNPKALVGHLALAKVLSTGGEDPLKDLVGKVTYMRSEAELVVKSEAFRFGEASDIPWVGVFKPTLQMDPAFAATEPPAHDDWKPEAVADPRYRTFVRTGFKRTRERVKEYLTPGQVHQETTDGTSTGALSDALATLAGSVGGSRAQREPGRRRAARPQNRSRLPRVKVMRSSLIPHPDPGRQWAIVELQLENASRARVTPRTMGLAVEGSSLPGEGQVRLEGWRTSRGDHVGQVLEVSGEDTFGAYISFPQGLAADVSFSAEVCS